jgi:hypothetical protein
MSDCSASVSERVGVRAEERKKNGMGWAKMWAS